MKNHNDALWLSTGIKPIEVNKVSIGELPTLAPQGHTWTRQHGWQDRLHMRIFCPPWSGKML